MASGAAGQEYWAAMELMGQYAAANHADHPSPHHGKAHRRPTCWPAIENHHNFAWRERHGGRDVIVHRKGATPAGRGVLGVIPGSMATPGLRRPRPGRGRLARQRQPRGRPDDEPDRRPRDQYRWAGTSARMLDAAGVKLLSAGIDEAPVAYKDIHAVMAAQRDLVEVIARFDPKIVKMADAGEKPED